MVKSWSRLLLALTMMLACVFAEADVLKGKVVNAETGEPLAGAVVQGEINPQPSWIILNNTSCDSLGCFYLRASYEGRVVITYSMLGFKTQRKVDYAYGKEVPDTTDVGVIKLQPTALMLKEVAVEASVPRITMRGDTIIFNPEAFKLKEGARLDELVRKLPGVENKDGKLYWNGKPIRLMMNGRDLFGGDAIVGQLPAEVAKKIKLYDRKSELSRHTGGDDGEEDHVLDIQVKPGFLDKWYGELDVNYQTAARYEGSIRASRLSNDNPQMVFAQANNRNRLYERSFNSNMNANVDADGKSQYGLYNYQHNWQTKGAENMRGNDVAVQADLNHSDGWGGSSSTTETFLPDTEHTLSLARNDRFAHKIKPHIGAKLFAYIDPKNNVEVKAEAKYEKMRAKYDNQKASYGYQPGQFAFHSLDAAMAAKPGDALYDLLIMRNHNFISQFSENKNLNVTYEWNHFIGKKGSFALEGSTSASGDDNERHISRQLEYLRDGRTESLWQYYDTPTREWQTMMTASLKYWLSKKVFVNVSDKVDFSRKSERRDLFADTDKSLLTDGVPTSQDKGNSMNDLLHKFTNQFTINSTINPSKKLMILPKLDWTLSRSSIDYHYGVLDTSAVRIDHAISPSLLIKWKMNRTRSMDLSFAYTTVTPDVTSTMGYRDYTDPLWVSMGNPQLGSWHSHTTKYAYRRMWLRKQIVLAASAEYTKNINPVTTLYRYNTSTGAYELMPVNVRGGDSWKFNLNYDHGISAEVRVMNKFAITTEKAYGYMTILNDEAGVPVLNRQSNLGVDNSFELAYELNDLQLKLYDQLQWNRYRYTDKAYNNTPLYNSLGVSANYTFRSFDFWLDISDDYRSGYSTQSMNRHRVMCGASIGYRFYKNKCHIELEADDIFNQENYYNVSYSAYQRSESSSDFLHHYLVVRFSYRFDAKGEK